LFDEPATLQNSGDKDQPGLIRFGDFDSNGYPDILITAKVGNSEGTTYIFENQGN